MPVQFSRILPGSLGRGDYVGRNNVHKTSERERAYELHKESCLLSNICLLSGIPDPIEMNIYSTIHMSRIERVYVSLLMRKCRAFPALQRKRYIHDSLSVSLYNG